MVYTVTRLGCFLQRDLIDRGWTYRAVKVYLDKPNVETIKGRKHFWFRMDQVLQAETIPEVAHIIKETLEKKKSKFRKKTISI
jgi:hypothetical protein